MNAIKLDEKILKKIYSQIKKYGYSEIKGIGIIKLSKGVIRPKRTTKEVETVKLKLQSSKELRLGIGKSK